MIGGGDFQRGEERIAKPYIDQIRLIQGHHQRHMVKRRAKRAVSGVDFPGYKRYLKADLLQQQGEYPVQFIAKPPAIMLDDFAEQPGLAKIDPLMIDNAQILEGHRQHMAAMQLLQSLQVGLWCACEADVLQVAWYVHRNSRYTGNFA
ncbi:hypothetical protein D3C75_1059400 [compost metagenome]